MRNILIIPFLFLIAQIQGTNPHYEEGDWISYSDSRYVSSIALGNQYVYFGTNGGITRYNFYENRWDFPFTTSNGLAGNKINVVAFDFSTGYLWCAGDWGISFYQPAARRWENIYNYQLRILPGEKITSIGVGEEHLWLETQGRFLKGDKLGGLFSPSAPPEVDVLWYGRLGRAEISFPNFFMPSGYFFFPLEKGGYIQDINLRRYHITSYLKDDWNNLWIGTWGLGAGLSDLRTDRLRLLPFGLMGKDVQALAFEADYLWIGGINRFEPSGGITRWDRRGDKWEYFEARYISGLRSDDVTVIQPDVPLVWIGTLDGLTLFNEKNGEWRTLTVFDGLSHNRIHDLSVSKGVLWVATENGIDMVLKSSLPSDSIVVRRILEGITVYDLELDQNLLWAGTERGVYIYDKSRGLGGFLEGLAGQAITAVSVCGKEVWFGTRDGVEVFDLERKQWLGPPARRFFTREPVNCILATKEAIWVGTNHGVLKYDRKRSLWRRFTTQDGLIDNFVHSILLEGDYIWFGTREGMTRFYWNSPHRID